MSAAFSSGLRHSSTVIKGKFYDVLHFPDAQGERDLWLVAGGWWLVARQGQGTRSRAIRAYLCGRDALLRDPGSHVQ